MTLLYLDTSAMFKRCVEEAGSAAPRPACFESDLRRAAAAEGLVTWPA